MTDATHFEGIKYSYRQSKDGIVISFLVQPHDVSTELATAPLGERYMVAFARIGDDEKPIAQPNQGPVGKEKLRTPWHELKPSQQAGIRSRDADFWRWARLDSYDEAVRFIREYCGIASRAELDTLDGARMKWQQLDRNFMERNEP